MTNTQTLLFAYITVGLIGFLLSIGASYAHWLEGRRWLSLAFGLQATLFPVGLIVTIHALR